MALVEITIGKDTHHLACENGEEVKLTNLANRFKDKIESLHSSFPTASDKTLYLMAGMMLIDEIEESFPNHAQQDNAATKEVIDEVTSKVKKLIEKLDNTCDVS
jgi:cell division protein ZapA|tara:strand:+ start:197 stop:508 length:312 start_codon:yes stop_codon:yes gene_type:complete